MDAFETGRERKDAEVLVQRLVVSTLETKESSAEMSEEDTRLKSHTTLKRKDAVAIHLATYVSSFQKALPFSVTCVCWK